MLNVYILAKRTLKKLYLHPHWGPDTYNSPHEWRAASKAEQPLVVQKKAIFKTIKSFSIVD